MRSLRVSLAAALVVALLPWLVPSATAAAPGWTQVSTKATGGISGLAPAPTGWVVVRDNKKVGQNRIALLSDAGAVSELSWPGAQPTDLEALSSVPGQPAGYAALTSAGTGYLLTVIGSDVTVNRSFTVPRGTANIESFTLTQIVDTTVAVWAVRGSTSSPAKVFAAGFSPATGQFGPVVTGRVTVPYPTSNVRQIADLTTSGGRLLASATSDPGASGPFTAALYDLGTVSTTSGRAVLRLQPPVQLGVYDHKVEGIACSGSTGLLGSDDEKLGGWTRTESFCG